MRRFRRLNRAWAYVFGYFWKPCPMCGEMFGGHECGEAVVAGKTGNWICCWRHQAQTLTILEDGLYEVRMYRNSGSTLSLREETK